MNKARSERLTKPKGSLRVRLEQTAYEVLEEACGMPTVDAEGSHQEVLRLSFLEIMCELVVQRVQ